MTRETLRAGPISRIDLAKAAIAAEYIRRTCFDRIVFAVGFQTAGTGVRHGAPGRIAYDLRLAGRSVEANYGRERGDQKRNPHHEFHLGWFAATGRLLVSPAIEL
jgi:hypothetical protein